MRNKEIICIQKYPNQVVLAHYSCSMIKPCQFSHYTCFWSVFSLYRNQRVILTNKYVVRCNFSKVPSQILKSFRIDNFPHLLFAYVVSKNQLPASYVKEAMAWNGSIALQKYTNFLTFLVTKFLKMGILKHF